MVPHYEEPGTERESFKRKVGQQYCYEMQFLWLYPWMRFACYLAGFAEAIWSQASSKRSGKVHSPIYHTGAQWLQWNRHRSRYSLISIVKQVFPKSLGNQLDLLVQGTGYFDVWILPQLYTSNAHPIDSLTLFRKNITAHGIAHQSVHGLNASFLEIYLDTCKVVGFMPLYAK